MQLSYDALNILIFLFPGLLAASTVRLLVYRKETGVFETIVTALLWSVAVYGFCAWIGQDVAMRLTETKQGDTVLRGIAWNPGSIGTMLCVSLLSALGVCYILNHDLIGAALRKLRVTTQSGRATIWLDVFAEYKRFVIVHLKDQRRVFGWVQHYSNSPDDGYIYLYEPKWITDDNKFIESTSHGLFFTKRELIDFIEFTNSPDPQQPVESTPAAK
jgi:hypothetical protein